MLCATGAMTSVADVDQARLERKRAPWIPIHWAVRSLADSLGPRSSSSSFDRAAAAIANLPRVRQSTAIGQSPLSVDFCCVISIFNPGLCDRLVPVWYGFGPAEAVAPLLCFCGTFVALMWMVY